ncbi:MAG: hypothetical protein UT24_C0003G0048 [Candidatus Woesebacteria bacterium GW2011_GWB1_39_12]|uniref:Uncharacterized protein n=1 Tax=Candidatus Woesebacteria bacterium GW2011_GWB1_39_12 TaxID=1618574 RepID=A0A0G0MMK8_9BACT|nr:MAG: hypothetical protein UT24_C0003G0048 [Candidatus Woesebacteria bacterium GW2011_GWB1_39_12]
MSVSESGFLCIKCLSNSVSANSYYCERCEQKQRESSVEKGETRMSRKRVKPQVDLCVNYRGHYLGYCNYFSNGGWNVSLNLNLMMKDLMRKGNSMFVNSWRKEHHNEPDGIDRFATFLGMFWGVYHHEIVGHALGHKLKVRGYSITRKEHFRWLEENLLKELFADAQTDFAFMFSDIAKAINAKFHVNKKKHDWLVRLGYCEILRGKPVEQDVEVR